MYMETFLSCLRVEGGSKDGARVDGGARVGARVDEGAKNGGAKVDGSAIEWMV